MRVFFIKPINTFQLIRLFHINKSYKSKLTFLISNYKKNSSSTMQVCTGTVFL